MIVYYPIYYKQFKCIADKCKHSCCVGWEIGLDQATANKYSALDSDFGKEIRSHISSDGSTIRLCEDDRCPFLDGSGLCRIISSLGEGYISDICREHPRFYHRVGDRIEGGIGMSCEEAARIILSSDNFAEFYSADREVDAPEETDYDSLIHRSYIYSVLSDKELSYREKMDRIKAKYATNISYDKDYWNEIFLELEYLDQADAGKIGIGKYDDRAEMQDLFVRFFAYLVFRHVSVAESYDNMRARVAFCILLCYALENMTADREVDFAEAKECARVISEEIEYSEDNTASLIFELESLV